MCKSYISRFSLFLAIFQALQCVFLTFHVFQCFSPYSRSYSVTFSFFTFFSVSHHTPGPTVWLSHFSRFSVFLAIFQFIVWLCLIFPIFQFSHQNPGPTVCIYHISRFSVFLAIFQFLQCVFLILHFFQGLLPYFISYHVSFPFSLFVSFLAIFQVLQCEFLILLVCQISCHIPVPTVCISHLHVFQCFSPYSRSYSVCVSFYTFFSFLATIQFQQFLSHFTRFFTASHHIPGPTLCVSHLALFSVLLTIFHVLAYEFLIFFVCHFSHHIPGPAGCLSHFSHFSLFLTTFHVLSCEFLIFFFVFQYYRHLTGTTLCISIFPRFLVFLAIFHVLPCVCVCVIFHVFSFFGIFFFLQCAFLFL